MPDGYLLDAQSARRVAAATRATEARGRDGTPLIGPVPPPRRSGDYQVWGRIGDAYRDGANWRWVYNFAEVYKVGAGYAGTWEGSTHGVSAVAYNGAEAINGPDGILGNGVFFGNLSDTHLEPKPVPAGVIARFTWSPYGEDGEGEWWFSLMNGIDGTC